MDPDFQIVGYHDPAPAGMEVLDSHGISAGKASDTPEDLVRAGGYDLLMVGSPNHLPLGHMRLGLEAGVKVFSEKPIVSTIEDTNKMAALMRHYGADRLLLGLVLRYAP